MASLAWLFVVASAASAGDVPDGIYRYSETGPGPRIERNDTGEAVTLGDRLAAPLGAAAIASTANDNSAFRLDLDDAGPVPEGADVGPLALVVAGELLPVYGHSDRNPDGTIDLHSVVRGREAAGRIAAALGVAPRLRRHPGHRLLTTFRPEKPSYRVGEPVTLVMTIRNEGERPVAFTDGGSQRGPRNNQFAFVAFRAGGFGKAVPDVGDPTNFGGLGGFKTLAPGESFEKPVELTDWFAFDEPDSYRVTGLYRLTLHEPDGPPFAGNLWDDFAAGDCVVRVVSGEAD